MRAWLIRQIVAIESFGSWLQNDLVNYNFRVSTHWKLSRTLPEILSMLKVKLTRWEFRRIRYYPKHSLISSWNLLQILGCLGNSIHLSQCICLIFILNSGLCTC
jgi:hypothetical protein